MKKLTVENKRAEIEKISRNISGKVRECRYTKKETFAKNERIIKARMWMWKQAVQPVIDRQSPSKPDMDEAYRVAQAVERWINKLTA